MTPTAVCSAPGVPSPARTWRPSAPGAQRGRGVRPPRPAAPAPPAPGPAAGVWPPPSPAAAAGTAQGGGSSRGPVGGQAARMQGQPEKQEATAWQAAAGARSSTEPPASPQPPAAPTCARYTCRSMKPATTPRLPLTSMREAPPSSRFLTSITCAPTLSCAARAGASKEGFVPEGPKKDAPTRSSRCVLARCRRRRLQAAG